ncbi:MAG TPA: aminotransferase class V-fold PLP-dependent enzyme [Methylibium sp.]|nr:aminotransferase class V-fold PLP-dependent enzyme [Methylibium sp.]
MNAIELPHTYAANLAPRVVGAQQRVPVLDGTLRRYINLDNAASTPALREVKDTVDQFMHWYSSVHRGAGFKSRVATQAYEDARHIVMEFVGADPATHVAIFGKNTTEAINKLAARVDLGADDVVLVSQLEHHSNDLPWRARARVEHVRADALGRLDEAHLDVLLERFAGRVRIVAVTGGSNVTGHLPDIYRIAVKAHAAGAQIFVDAAQLAPHRAIDMGALDDPAHLDYIAISAHKMYAPFGTGALIGRRDTFERGAPEQRGGGTVMFVSHDDVTWAAGPDRDEAGSPNVVGAVALAAAVQALAREGMDRLAHHETMLTAHALTRFATVPGVRVYGDADPARAADRLGVITFNVEGLSHALVAAILSTEFAIGVRNGCFCAHPYLMHLLGLSAVEAADVRRDILNGDARAMPGMVRISFGLYNTIAEVDAVVDALAVIARGEFAGVYMQDPASGEYAAVGFAPDLALHFRLRTLRAATRVSLRAPLRDERGVRLRRFGARSAVAATQATPAP